MAVKEGIAGVGVWLIFSSRLVEINNLFLFELYALFEIMYKCWLDYAQVVGVFLEVVDGWVFMWRMTKTKVLV